MKCHYCHIDPGMKPNSIVWNGFLDKDMHIYVGHCCHNKHYMEKWKTKFKGLFSEFPVTIPEPQLKLF